MFNLPGKLPLLLISINFNLKATVVNDSGTLTHSSQVKVANYDVRPDTNGKINGTFPNFFQVGIWKILGDEISPSTYPLVSYPSTYYLTTSPLKSHLPGYPSCSISPESLSIHSHQTFGTAPPVTTGGGSKAPPPDDSEDSLHFWAN